MNTKTLVFFSLFLLLAKTPTTFGMQAPLDEQQIDAVAQQLNTAITNAQSQYLCPENLKWPIGTLALEALAIKYGKECIENAIANTESVYIRFDNPADGRAVFICALGGLLLFFGAKHAIKDINALCTTYETPYELAKVQSIDTIKRLLLHPKLQGDFAQAVLNAALNTKS